jgi:peptidoglycan/LPS O-acetylase OafA/YrhL
VIPASNHNSSEPGDVTVPLAAPGAAWAAVPGAGAASRTDADLPAITSHQPALDGLRVIAAIAVLVVHVGGETGFAFTGSPASWVVSRGDVGVPIFFVLSGLLLYRPWARAVIQGKAVPAARTYLYRRALRILPAYWVVVIIALPVLNTAHATSPVAWIQNLGLIQVYDPHPWWSGTGAQGLGQMWSLAVEVSFYALLPVIAAGLAAWARRGAGADARARRLLGGLAVLAGASYGFAVLEYYPSGQFWLGDTLPRLLTWFAPGMALAVVSVWCHADSPGAATARRFCRTVAFSAGTCWLIAAVAFAIACSPIGGPETLTVQGLWETEIKTALYTVVATALVAPAALQPARVTRFTELIGNQVMSFLGKISYGVFLWQFLVIYGIFALFHLKDAFSGGHYTLAGNIVLFVTVAIVTIVMSAVSYYVIERPALRLQKLRRRDQGRHSRAVPSPEAVSDGEAAVGRRAAGPQAMSP